MDSRIGAAILCISWQETHQCRSDTHEQEGRDQRRFPANAITKPAKEGATYGTCKETYKVGRERRDGTGDRIKRWEEDFREDGCGKKAVQEEIIPFDGCANGAGTEDREHTPYTSVAPSGTVAITPP